MKHLSRFNESINLIDFKNREESWKFKESRLKANAIKLASVICPNYKTTRSGFYMVSCDMSKMKELAKSAGYNVTDAGVIKGFVCEKNGMYFLVDNMIMPLQEFRIISSGKDLKNVIFFDGHEIVKIDFVRGDVLRKSESHKDPSVYSMESTDKKYIGEVSFFGDPQFSVDFDEIIGISKKPGV